MGFVEWAMAMRKKSLSERRRFVALATISIMAVVTCVWFTVFFANLFLERGGTKPSEDSSVPSVGGRSFVPPFPDTQ